MKNEILDVIVVGAGHAGLSASYFLKQKGMKHLVLERGTIGESWRTQRWNSFVMNTGYACNQLPGNEYQPMTSEFVTATAFADALHAYANRFQLPVKEQATVVAVEKMPGQSLFTVKVSEKGEMNTYTARQVLISSGSQNTKKAPAFAYKLPASLLQLHASEYRHANQLPEGAVLVVGSAQSGCQVAADIAASGKKVWLSTSMVGRVPRRYRGKDIMDWLFTIRFFDVKRSEVTDPHIIHIKAPQLTGAGGGNQTISLQWLSKQGIGIVGKTNDANDKDIFFQPDAATHVQFADGFSAMVKNKIDDFIAANDLQAPAPEEDLADMPDNEASCISPVSSLNIKAHNITAIIWTTGFGADFSFIRMPVTDNEGKPIHQEGASPIEGLYFLGLPWLRTMKSALINGTREDAAFIVDRLYTYAQQYDVNPVQQL